MMAGKKKGRVVLLGADGMDPRLLDTLLKQGRMPNFRKVMDGGIYSRLRTTNPAESPVAWSSFSTGKNPGKHGIFDFLHRDPATYRPKIAAVTVTQRPNRKPIVKSNRKGDTFVENPGRRRSSMRRYPGSAYISTRKDKRASAQRHGSAGPSRHLGYERFIRNRRR